ncbi:MAG: hypothetical protein MR025_00355 [Helicobacter trogontum]|uniref:hypothetical protein n=1 Tax=Helicobacter trogontum TaxID=50960 RepID=UPI000CF0EAA4|nr:hypothetical protein [Helicobacter trogontum]MCI5785896.1 hypothetical protein [Helicobacter trogontum]
MAALHNIKHNLCDYTHNNQALNPIGCLKTHMLFYIILLLDVALLCFMVDQTSIYIKEAYIFFDRDSLPSYLANFAVSCVQYFFHDSLLNDYGMRLPFICLHILNCILMYNISLHILRKNTDSILSVVLFMAIPGVSAQALILSYMGILTFLCLLIVYIQIRYKRIAYELFIIVVFLDSGSAILCLALFFYALLKRKTYTIVFSMVCFGINMYQFSPIHGVPHSYVLDTLGLMALVFTPVFFVYYIAATYSYTFKKSPLLLNLIPFVGFLFIMLFSTRQKIEIESFLPPLCVGIPFFMQKILFDLRSRLPQFRMRYKIRIYGLVLFLLFGNIVLFGNKLTYYVSDVQHNFAYSFYEAKDLAKELYKRNITHINVSNSDLALRLNFYGINTSIKPTLPKYALVESNKGSIVITYGNIKVSQYAIISYDYNTTHNK